MTATFKYGTKPIPDRGHRPLLQILIIGILHAHH